MNRVETDRNQLITDNMGLISLAVKRYIGFGVDFIIVMLFGNTVNGYTKRL